MNNIEATGLYITMFIEFFFLAALFFTAALFLLKTFLLPRKRDEVFRKLAVTYGLQYQQGVLKPFQTLKRSSGTDQPVARVIKGIVNGHAVMLGDFCFSEYPDWYRGRVILPRYIFVRGWQGIHTILVVDGKQKDIGGTLTGYASEEVMRNTLDILQGKSQP